MADVEKLHFVSIWLKVLVKETSHGLHRNVMSWRWQVLAKTCACFIRVTSACLQGKMTGARVCWCMLQGEHMLVLTVEARGEGGKEGQAACVGSGVYSC